MAKASPKKVPRVRKKPSFREQANKARVSAGKTGRLRKTARGIKRPFTVISNQGKKEYYLPMPDNKVGRFLNKRRGIIPVYFKEAWAELRRVTWPTRKETWKLTFAVFIFAVVFGLLISVTDYGLDKLFKKVILKI